MLMTENSIKADLAVVLTLKAPVPNNFTPPLNHISITQYSSRKTRPKSGPY